MYRRDGQYIQVTATYDSDKVPIIVEDTKEKLQGESDTDRLGEAGFSEDQVADDFGQESDNDESFVALGTIFPIAILGILVLLAFQFRSVLQPLQIILGIPFSLFGVSGGLYITNNAISFFSMIGLIGLIGIALNNTILLIDYANQ